MPEPPIDPPSDASVEVVIFTSPKAGSGGGRDQLPRLIELLKAENIRVETINSVDDLSRFVTSGTTDPNRIVVAAGGDGTIGLVAQTIGDAAIIVPMPLGTENLLSKHFGYLSRAESVRDAIVGGREQRMDVGTVNGKPFLVMATCGFDAEVVRAMHLTRRGHIRRWSYLWPITRALGRYRFPGIKVHVDDDHVLHGGWAMVFNVPRYAASLAIEPDAIPDDGLLDVIVFQSRSILRSIVYLTGIASGRHVNYADVVRVRGRSITIAPETENTRIPYQTDGDYAGRLPARIEVLPGHIRLRLPTTAST